MLHLLAVLVTIAVLLVLVSCGWVGDVIALAMPVVLAGAAITALVVLAVRPAWSTVPIAAMITSAVIVFGPRWPHHTAAPVRSIRIAAVNLQFDSRDQAGGVESAVAADADVLVVSELTPETDRLLSAAYPERVVTENLLLNDKFAEGVYSRFSLTRLESPKDVSYQLLRVAVGGETPFVLYAVHLPRPTLTEPTPFGMTDFAGNRTRAFALDRAADDDEGPVVIAGDLNLSDRTSGYRRLAAGRLDVSRTGWAGSTYIGDLSWSLLLLRIDHLFAPAGWCAAGARSFDLRGSDHRGVAARIGPCP